MHALATRFEKGRMVPVPVAVLCTLGAVGYQRRT